MPNAIDARMVSLCAASMPSTSKGGSASAEPSRCASASTSAKSRPLSRISVRIKLPVPLMMPASHSMRLPARSSGIVLMTGMPPATAASKATITPCCCASAKITYPYFAISALLAVTTCLPLAMARRTRSSAVVVPPINSTTTSTSGSSTTANGSSVSVMPAVSQLRVRLRSRAAARVMTMPRPARRSISWALRFSTFTVPPPTVPRPTSPTFTGFNCIILVGANARWLAASLHGGRLALGAAEHIANAAYRLAGAVRVFDEREAHMGVAVFAETDAGRHGDLGFLKQFFGKLQRTEVTVRLGDGRPHEHRAARRRHVPADGIAPFAQHVAAAAIALANLIDAGLRPLQRRDGGDLDRRKHAVIEIGFHARLRRHQLVVAAHEADAPARHVVALRQCEEFHREILRARHLQYRRRFITVEHDVGIGDVVHDPYAVLSRNGHGALEKLELDALGGGIARKIQHQHLRLGPAALDGLFQLFEKIDARHQRHMTDIGPGDD